MDSPITNQISPIVTARKFTAKRKIHKEIDIGSTEKKRKQPDFDSLQKRNDERIEKIEKYETPSENQEEKPVSFGFICDHFFSVDRNEHLRVPASTIIELGNLIKSEMKSCPKRGPKQALTVHDKLIIYLEWLSSSTNVDRIGLFLGTSQTLVSKSIAEIRFYLFTVLEKMFSIPPRPPKEMNEDFPNVALLVDATTIKIPKPDVPYEENQYYYDGHHNAICMKVEVAVSSWPPFKALFISNAERGGLHDVALFRQGMNRYVEYLKMTDEEKRRTSKELNIDRWAIMGDKGYQGHFTELRLITPIKKNIADKFYRMQAEMQIQSLTMESNAVTPNSSIALISSPSPSHSSASCSLLTSHSSSPCFPSPSSLSETSSSSSSFETSFAKSSLSIEEFNKRIAKCRVPVEWFFGRLKKLWLRFSEKYTGGIKCLSSDFKIACWLTNIVIDYHNLEPSDGIFYQKVTAFSWRKETQQKQIREINSRACSQRRLVRKSSNCE
ncbi:uncharacterized protein MONOS_4747 [Monocercomonoides exilis]|uniref:uncharacterized protein n=1 Tax=Monocercomonoides exilis TaxID=2049356 RepID=UPI003559E24B|nr:hypothetical protein MONOS_4747 [Monocercomonoides exilis]|eukprot:MONOS_4747.1-p1 / transcript=MONOS_4747.1 / gene=MONOS_4747 / organism=Monocercomonoides_exilis_PA203 / gene_product=unspecified product / transcript_product=unspecified product / location=Mono_scaffold00130:66457-67947(+) / protein_length=496 / sequence_SO=supercontig / SO=protein_coding / is_pseudo=false